MPSDVSHIAESLSWSVVTMDTDTPTLPRYAHSTVLFENKVRESPVLAFPSSSSSFPPSSFPSSYLSSSFPSSSPPPPPPLPPLFLTDQLYVFAGQNEEQELNDVWAVQTKGNTLTLNIV